MEERRGRWRKVTGSKGSKKNVRVRRMICSLKFQSTLILRPEGHVVLHFLLLCVIRDLVDAASPSDEVSVCNQSRRFEIKSGS